MKSIIFGTRKLHKLNKSCFVVLPKIWTENMGLHSGNKVFIEMASNGDLIIKQCDDVCPK